MKKVSTQKVLLATAAFALVAVFVVIHSLRNNRESTPLPSEKNETPLLATTVSHVSQVATSTTYKDKIGFCDIEVTYPFIVNEIGAQDDGARTANLKMGMYTADLIENFTTNARDNEEMLSRLQKDNQEVSVCDLSVSFEVATSSKTKSYLLSEESFTGGAHPSHTLQSFTYDFTKKRFITIGDIFMESDTFYQKLSSIAFTSLKKDLTDSYKETLGKSDEDMIRDGLKDKGNSFSRFTLTDFAVTFYFNEYQVAPYVAGPQSVTIPLSDLEAFRKK